MSGTVQSLVSQIEEHSVFTRFILVEQGSTEVAYDSLNDFGMYRVNTNDRYTEQFVPDFEDKIVTVPGKHGGYYFGTKYKSKPFQIQVAFDHMTEQQFRDFKNLCERHIKEPEPLPFKLIFDDTPYKFNLVYLQKTPTFSYLAFTENGQTVLKGEGTIDFVCYEPFARNLPVECIPSSFKYNNRWFDNNMVGTSTKGIINLGDLPIHPIITVRGKNGNSFNQVVIALSYGTGESLASWKTIKTCTIWKNQNDTFNVVIDCQNGIAFSNKKMLKITTGGAETTCVFTIPSQYQASLSHTGSKNSMRLTTGMYVFGVNAEVEIIKMDYNLLYM